jgi:hypothetical protein
VPYDIAKKVCMEKCFKIRRYLAPLFGPDFVENCVPLNDADLQEPSKRRPGRHPRHVSPSFKRPIEHIDGASMHLPDRDSKSSDKRRRPNSLPSTPRSTPPPRIECQIDSSVEFKDICPMLGAALVLMRFDQSSFEALPPTDCATLGDSRLAGDVSYKGRQYVWNGADQLVEKIERVASPPSLPPMKDLVQPITSPRYGPYPMTPHESPSYKGSYDWHMPAGSAMGPMLISPPMSSRGSFSGKGRESSISATDGCDTPITEVYNGPLFPSPQLERGYLRRDERY